MERAADSLVSDFAKLLGEEYRLLRGVGGEVAELRDDLEAMNALLVMQSEVEDGGLDQFSGVMMKQVRELAYDSEDCVEHYKLRIKCHWRGDVLAWSRRLLGTLFLRHCLAGEIKALRARGNAITERQARYMPNRDALRRTPLLPAPTILTASASEHALRPEQHQVFGIDDQVDAVTKMLEAGIDGEGDRKVVAIVGFGGLGKTTLAMKVCQQLEAVFPYQAMVPVSQAFEPSRDREGLLKRVLQQVITPKRDVVESPTEGSSSSPNDGIKELELGLEDKRYLIVIDDVWTIRAWEEIEKGLPRSKCGSRIIVTTRIDTVAKACTATFNGHYIHKMKPLNEEESKKLFIRRTFSSLDATCPDDLKDIMVKILKKCGGLPLAIVSIASILAGYRSSGCKEKWENIYKSISSQMESHPTLEGMRQIVTLSYQHLSYELKACMMYLSIFPEDYEIKKDRLLCRWIAEGLVPEKRGFTQIEVAESFLDELISRNMINLHPGSIDYRETYCQVHDMLLEVMVSKSLESNFVSLLGGPDSRMSYGTIRRLSIHGSVDKRHPAEKNMRGQRRGMGHGFVEANFQHVRSLSMFQDEGHKHLLDQLGKFPLLRVLDLEGCKDLANNHMKYVCRLYLLRFLSLRGTTISMIPHQVQKLEHLQTLDVRDTEVTQLPHSVTNLEKLECLFSNECKLRRGLMNMKALREVTSSYLEDDVEVAKELGELGQLQKLGITLNHKSSDELQKELGNSLDKISTLHILDIQTRDYKGGNNVLGFLLHLCHPPRLLRSIRMAGTMNGFPSWVGSLTYLVVFDLAFAKDIVADQLFEALSKLPCLERVVLWDLIYRGNELVARTKHTFPVLRILNVVVLPEVFRFEEGSMANLETLLVDFQYYQDRSIHGVKYLKNLKEVQLSAAKHNHVIKSEADRLRGESKSFKVVVTYW